SFGKRRLHRGASFWRQTLPPLEDVEEIAECGEQYHRSDSQGGPQSIEGGPNGRRVHQREVRDHDMGILRQPPANQDARHLGNRSRPSPVEASSPQGRERSDRAYAGDGEEERRPPARQPREDLQCPVSCKKKCQRCHWRQEEAGGERPLAKVLLEVRLALR